MDLEETNCYLLLLPECLFILSLSTSYVEGRTPDIRILVLALETIKDLIY